MSTEIVDYPHGFSTLIPTTDQGAPSLPTALPSQGWVELISRTQPVRLVFEGARLQPCHKPSPKQGDSAPEVNLRNHHTARNLKHHSTSKARCGPKPYRGISPLNLMDCSLWKA